MGLFPLPHQQEPLDSFIFGIVSYVHQCISAGPASVLMLHDSSSLALFPSMGSCVHDTVVATRGPSTGHGSCVLLHRYHVAVSVCVCVGLN